MRTDKYNAEVEIDFYKHMSHMGRMFVASHTASKNTAETLSLQVQTPNVDKLIHARISVFAGAAVQFRVYETSTYSGGSGITPANRDRSSILTAPGTWVTDATNPATGDVVAGMIVYPEWQDKAEFILKKKYQVFFCRDVIF
jgi:hypothetical protein